MRMRLEVHDGSSSIGNEVISTEDLLVIRHDARSKQIEQIEEEGKVGLMSIYM